MDPNCAICNNPPKHSCDCERRSLIHAVEESERRVLSPLIADIRFFLPSSPRFLPFLPANILAYYDSLWVTTQARASIHQDFRAREARRRADYERWRRDNHGRITRTELEEEEYELHRGINDDWRAAVERYPDVLDYFYGLVGWTRGSGGGGGGSGVRRGEVYLTRRG